MESVTAAELLEALDGDRVLALLDVRTPEEFAAWSIDGAVNLPLDELADRLDEVPRDRPILTICAAGNRSRAAAEFLAQQGFEVAEVTGGMAAWASVYDEVAVELDGLTCVQVRRRGKGCLSYVLIADGEAIVVDPGVDTERYLEILATAGARCTTVLETHLHADHLSGARLLASATGATLALSDADPFGFPHAPLPATVAVGRHEVAVWSSPGHTRGSTMYLVDGQLLLTGDTLFLEGVGRPDLADRAEEFAVNLYASIHRHLDPLGDEILILPAHYGPSVEVHGGQLCAATLGELRANLAPLSMDEDAFVAWAVGQAKDRPGNYEVLVEANRGAEPKPFDELLELELGPNRCAVSTPNA